MRSLLSMHLLSSYMLVLTGTNGPIGVIRAIQGVSEMIFSFPVAHVADKRLRRDTCLRAAGVSGFVCAVVLAYAFHSGQLYTLYAAYAVLGVFLAAFTPPLEALFIDSIPFGQRTAPLLIKNSIMYGAMTSMGPILSIIGFLWFGNTWKLPQLNVMMYVGIFFLAVACIVLFMFRDNHITKATDNTTEEIVPLRTPTMVATELMEVTFDENDARREEAQQATQLFTESTPLIGLQEMENESAKATTLCGWLSEKHVPWLLYLSDVIMYQADGMTVNYLGVFFVKEYGMLPIQLEVTCLFQAATILGFSALARHGALQFGRIETMVAVRAVSIVALVLLCYVRWLPLVLCFFLLRVGMTCSVLPLSRSMLMDYVPKNERATWNAFDSVTRFAFAESAVVGGLIIDHYGSYRLCFLIAAIVAVVGLVVDLLVLPLVRHRRWDSHA
ncbi:TPA: hypothetical protein N0F65_012405 [Lagenidium giganteum]|uniref:Major facilitator superfamily (MFS) profile domain-containing protein n=1 Tax=Lagenidium giganteum TaxID=4803 RepID=A0AAV2YQ81_9STRA|nr:TPA: hypothetical protein N0F65_012405 [Lagenidium giganteum]